MLAVEKLARNESNSIKERTYLARPSIICIWLQQVPDKIFSIVTDILPVPLMKYDSSVTALVDEVLEILASERGISAKKCVRNNTH